jgi:hypothetical protein
MIPNVKLIEPGGRSFAELKHEKNFCNSINDGNDGLEQRGALVG